MNKQIQPSPELTAEQWLARLQESSPAVGIHYAELVHHRVLQPVAVNAARAYAATASSLERGGTL